MAKRGITEKSLWLLISVLGVTSLVFLLLFWGTYQFQLREERAQASNAVNQLLQASLENAMLKRDLPGLRGIVRRLSEQKDILNVVILNPSGEVRFTGDDRMLGVPFEEPLNTLCPGCENDFSQAEGATHFVSAAPNGKGKGQGGKMLRSVNPVKNKHRCTECHGSIESNPVNGILVVDYDAEPIIQKARTNLLWLGLAGLIVLSAAGAAFWFFMKRQVLMPVEELRRVSDLRAQGNLDARVKIDSEDEFQELGQSFNIMAERLNNSLQQIMDSEVYLQALINAIPDGLRVVDQDFNIIQTNQAYNEQYQLEDKAQTRCYKSSHHRDAPCVPTLVRCPVHELGLNPGPVKAMHHFIRKDGSQVEVQVFAAPLTKHGQTKAGEHEKTLIVQSIRNLSEDVQFSHEQKLSSVGQLAAGVAHEIRNPLSSIRLALQSTLSRLETEDTEVATETEQYLRVVDGEIDRCIDVTKRLLNLSSLTSDTLQLVDLNRAIEETLSLLKFEAEQRRITISTDYTTQPLRILAANSDARMLILNLIQNAFHAMPDGGELRIQSTVNENDICLSFRDNGVGISDDHKPYIFDPFFSHRADQDRGTGLGLAICQSIVQRYKGQIQVHDVEPHGSCFEVRFIYLEGEEEAE